MTDDTQLSQQVRVSHKNAATGELTLELPGDYTVLQVQQRGDNTYVVLKPDPTGEKYQKGLLAKLDAINEGEVAEAPGLNDEAAAAPGSAAAEADGTEGPQ